MNKLLKRIVIALCAVFSVAVFALVGCNEGNESTLPPTNEQVDTGEEINDQGETSEEDETEQDITEETPTDEGKPSIPGGLVDGGEFSGNKT